MATLMLHELEKMRTPAKKAKPAVDDSVYKVGSTVMIPRVYYPCVFIPGEDYRKPLARLTTSDCTFITRCVPCEIAPKTCSLFKLFDDRFKYKTVRLDYDFEPLPSLSIRICACSPVGTRRPISAYLKQLFENGAYFDGEIVPQCVNGVLINFRVSCEKPCVFCDSDFIFKGVEPDLASSPEIEAGHGSGTIINPGLCKQQDNLVIEREQLESRLSGFDNEVVDLTQNILRRLTSGTRPASCLLHGPPGHGKSTYFKVLQEIGELYVGGALFLSAADSNAFHLIQDVKYERAVIFIDEIDSLTKPAQTALSTAFQTLGKRVFVIAASNRLLDLENRLRSSFHVVLEIKQGPSAKLDMIEEMVGADSAPQVIQMCSEFSPADIVYIIENSCHSGVVDLAALARQIRIHQPSNLKNLSMQRAEMVYGHSQLIRAISQSIEGGLNRNFLLFGPPGSGKNQIIKYYMLNNIKIPVSSASEVVSPYVGQSEKRLYELFREAESAVPGVLFFDEIDGLFADNEEYIKRLWTCFREELHEKRNLTLIMATNKPWALPKELLGLSQLLYVGGLSAGEAAEMVRQQLQGIAESDWEAVGRACEGCVGAAVQQCIQRVKLAAMRGGVGESSCNANIIEEIEVMEHFEQIQPVDFEIAQKYEEFISQQ